MIEPFNAPLSTVKSNIYIGLSTQIQDANISFLRQYFKSMASFDGTNKKYNQDICKSMISIEGEFPRRHVRYALIIVSPLSGGNLMDRLIGNELYTKIKEVKDGKEVVTGYSLGGVFTSDFSISIASESTAERRDLLDLVVILYRTIGSEYLRKFGVNITSIRYGSSRTEYLANDFVYFDTLNFTVQTEWKQVIKNIPLITEINVEEVAVEEEPIF